MDKIKFCYPEKISNISKNKALNQIASEVSIINKEKTKKHIKDSVFGRKEKASLPNLKPHEDKIKKIILSSLKKCREIIEIPELQIFIFPSQNTFIESNMKGTSGVWPMHKNVLLIFINLKSKKWKNQLPNSIIHETAHVISGNNFDWSTILDSIIFEGIAEHFREKVLNDKEKEPWTKSIPKEKAFKILKELDKKNKLKLKEGSDLHNDLFFGLNKYPKWSGYTIGYILIERVLKTKNINIEKLLKISPKKILNIYKINYES